MNLRKITRDKLDAYAVAHAKHRRASEDMVVPEKTNSMALWMGEMSAKVYLTWAANIQREVTSHGYDLIITEMGDLCADDSGHCPIPEWPVDGIFVYGLPGLSNSLEMSPKHAPIVVFGPYPVKGLDFVGLSFYDAGAESVRDQIARGRKRIVYVRPLPVTTSGRYQAYLDVMGEAGLEIEDIITSVQDAGDSMKAYLETHKCPDAILCCNDDAAIGVLRSLRDLGINVPGDVAIVGGDGLEDTDYHEPRLSTIAIPYAESAKISWEYMEQRIRDPFSPLQETMLQARYVPRESSK